MNNLNLVLSYSCVIVFIVTAVITLLSILDIIKIPGEFRNKLFYVLIVEIVVTGVLAFKNTILKEPVNVIRTVTPGDNKPWRVSQNTSFFINGFCQKQENVSFKGVVVVDKKQYSLGDFSMTDRNTFSVQTIMPDTMTNRNALIVLHLVVDGKVIFSDTCRTILTVK